MQLSLLDLCHSMHGGHGTHRAAEGLEMATISNNSVFPPTSFLNKNKSLEKGYHCPAMGNRFSTTDDERFTVLDPHCARKNRRKSAEFRRSLGSEECSGEKCNVDWNNDESVKHRSAMNSLHNYAIGKMSAEERRTSNKPSSPKKASIRFADVLEHTIFIDRSLLCMDSLEIDSGTVQLIISEDSSSL